MNRARYHFQRYKIQSFVQRLAGWSEAGCSRSFPMSEREFMRIALTCCRTTILVHQGKRLLTNRSQPNMLRVALWTARLNRHEVPQERNPNLPMKRMIHILIARKSSAIDPQVQRNGFRCRPVIAKEAMQVIKEVERFMPCHRGPLEPNPEWPRQILTHLSGKSTSLDQNFQEGVRPAPSSPPEGVHPEGALARAAFKTLLLWFPKGNQAPAEAGARRTPD